MKILHVFTLLGTADFSDGQMKYLLGYEVRESLANDY